jgi:predicted AlkP superfamily pyrophosphatase or phosphodiesterase
MRKRDGRSIANAVKAVNSGATVVALSSEKVYAADAMGGPGADHVLYMEPGSKDKHLLPRALAGHSPVPAALLQQSELTMPLPLRRFTDLDRGATKLAVAVVERLRPDVLLVNLPAADKYGHKFGGPATPAIMAKIVTGLDRNVGRILDAYKMAGMYDDTLFVVTADHGMVPNNRTVPGPTVRAVVEKQGGKYHFHTGGTAAYIYIRSGSRAQAVSSALLDVSGVNASYYRVTSGDSYAYRPSPAQRIAPELDAAYAYLLDTFSCAESPDVVALFRENTIGHVEPTLYGYHGGADWNSLRVPLVFSGPGIRQGAVSQAPARLVDIAPTALRAMGISHAPLDGVVLADALETATKEEIATQAALVGPLSAHQEALIHESAANLAEDEATGHRPPEKTLALVP